jgi:hypothetical protein
MARLRSSRPHDDEIVRRAMMEMTMNVYGRVTLDDKRRALDRLGRLFAEDASVGVDINYWFPVALSGVSSRF